MSVVTGPTCAPTRRTLRHVDLRHDIAASRGLVTCASQMRKLLCLVNARRALASTVGAWQ